MHASTNWAHVQLHDSKEVGGRFRCPPLGVRCPYYTAAVKALVIAVIPAVSDCPIAPPAPTPNTADTAPIIQTATIMYSNDTTPSWSVRRRFNASVVLM